MKNFFFSIAALALVGLFAQPASAAPDGPLLVPADLDRAVTVLPIKAETDPVGKLKDRLAQLRQMQVSNPERPALSQALDIIRLTRTIRLTTSQRPMVAGL